MQKGGLSAVMDVLKVGQPIPGSGLYLLDGPGNDLVAMTNLMAAGCQVILFTTGRGNPAGAPVPTVKISTNTGLARKKSGWIDFDAGVLLEDPDLDKHGKALLSYVLQVAEGTETCAEKNGYREISIFKDGVTL